MFDNFEKFLQGREAVRVSAKATIPGPETPRTPPRQRVLPSYLTTAKPNPDSFLPLQDRQLANTDITTLRTGTSSRQIIADFVRASPDLSAAVTAYVRTGITSGYTAVAKNLDGTFNPEATAVLAQLVTRMDVLNDYTVGFDDAMSLRAVSETFARDLLMTGGMSGELVLDKARLPTKIQPIATRQISFKPSTDGKRLRPVQRLGGEEIDLDIPTFFMTMLDQDAGDAYSVSPIEPAIQAVLFSADFMNDIRRIVKKSIHPRVIASIVEEKFRQNMPEEAKFNQEKANEYLDALIDQVTQQVNNMSPEDAMVIFDTIQMEVLDHGNTNLSNEYKVISEMINAKLATGAKVLPTVLGHSNGTSNVASAEVLLFMKYVEGTVWAKLNEMLSKIMTLAVRLLGQDVYVEFRYNAIDLRPESELEAFKSMKQSRILDLLSIGMIGDDEACVQLTGHLPPAGYKQLAGTGFRAGTSSQPAGDGYNGASNSGSTMNQNLKSDAPQSPKGKQRAEAEVIPLAGARQ